MPLAYSYLRFSSPEQAQGDSVRRQIEARDNWLAAHRGVELDQTLVMTDAGRSAFKRKDWHTYALANFKAQIKSGRVQPGSFLLLENLDRLSREDEGVATELFLSIVNRGVIIVRLLPSVMEFCRPVSSGDLFNAIIELSRGHGESLMKSERVGSAWANKRTELARGKPQPANRSNRVAGMKFLTHKLPAWIAEKNGQLVLKPDKAPIVQRVFGLALQGFGTKLIAQKFNAEGVPVLARTTFKGRPVEWSATTVYCVLTSKAVIGAFQPHRGRGSDRTPCGELLPNYFPRVVTDDDWYAVQGVLKTRATCGRGRRGKHINIFSGLLTEAVGGGSVAYRHTKTRPPTLIPIGFNRDRRTPWRCFQAEPFEQAVLSELAEVKVADVLGEDTAGRKVAVLTGRKTKVESLIKFWTSQMDDEAILSTVAAKLSELHAQLNELADQLADAQREAACPASEAWGEFQTLAHLLATDNSPEMRTRVRAAMRRCVESVHCIFASSGRLRLAAAQIRFRGSDHHRDYVVIYDRFRRGPEANACQVVAEPFAGEEGELDLRRKKDAAKMAKLLETLSPRKTERAKSGR